MLAVRRSLALRRLLRALGGLARSGTPLDGLALSLALRLASPLFALTGRGLTPCAVLGAHQALGPKADQLLTPGATECLAHKCRVFRLVALQQRTLQALFGTNTRFIVSGSMPV